MTSFVSNDPLDNLTNTINRPITIPAYRNPTVNDIYPPNTAWVNESSSPYVIWLTTGAGNWFQVGTGSGDITITGNSGGPVTSNAFTIVGTGGTTFAWDGTQFVITSASPSGFTWNEVSGTSQTMSPGNGYICNNAALTTLTLPPVGPSSVGDAVKIISSHDNTAGFKIALNANNQLLYGVEPPISGPTGYLQTSTDENEDNSISLICIAIGSPTVWSLDAGPQGNFVIGP